MLRSLVALCLAVIVVACAAQGGRAVAADQPAPPAAVGAVSASGDDLADNYRLGTGDRVRLTVFNEPTLSGEFAVSASGELSLPLIGSVPARDKTTREIGDDVRQRLAGGYLRDPRVSMEVITFRPFFILGEVKSPGQYPYVTGLTVLNAVATAQGFTPRASKKTVFIRHSGEDREVAYPVTPSLRILPGDTIRFSERYF